MIMFLSLKNASKILIQSKVSQIQQARTFQEKEIGKQTDVDQLKSLMRKRSLFNNLFLQFSCKK